MGRLGKGPAMEGMYGGFQVLTKKCLIVPKPGRCVRIAFEEAKKAGLVDNIDHVPDSCKIPELVEVCEQFDNLEIHVNHEPGSKMVVEVDPTEPLMIVTKVMCHIGHIEFVSNFNEFLHDGGDPNSIAGIVRFKNE